MRRSYADDISGDEIMKSGADIENDRVKDLLAGAFIAAAGRHSPGRSNATRSSQPGCPSSNAVVGVARAVPAHLILSTSLTDGNLNRVTRPLRAKGGVSDWRAGWEKRSGNVPRGTTGGRAALGPN